MYQPSFSELIAFCAVVRHRNFRAAASELEVSPSALSHALRNLEDRIGLRLLNRTTRSVAPTEAGAWLLARLTPLLQEFDRTFEELSTRNSEPRGRLKISAGILAAKMLFHTAVPAFRRRYPNIELDLVVDGEFVDIVAGGFDAGIRFRDSVPQDMVIVRFGSDTRFIVVASPSYWDDHLVPEKPADLMEHECIRYRMPSGKVHNWEFAKDGNEFQIDVRGALTLDQTELMIAAASEGLGVAHVLDREAASHISEGRLIAILQDWCPVSSGFCLYYPGHRHVPAPLRAFIEVLKETR